MEIKNKILKIIFISIMTFVTFSFTVKVNATDDIFQSADNFLEKDKGMILNMSSIKTTSDTLFNIFSAFGVVIVVIVGAILGIQFMMGSIEEKVKVKEALIPYVIGSIIIFAAVGIWLLVSGVLQGVFQ